MNSNITTGDIKDAQGNVIGGWGEIRPSLCGRVDLAKVKEGGDAS